MEVDLELGLPEAINLKVSYWSHIQELDYQQIPFKCRYFHEHGHFARYCKKKAEEETKKNKDQWIQPQKFASSRLNNKKKGKETTRGHDVPEVR